MSATFSYNSTNGQPTAVPANGFYHAPTSGFQLQQYPPALGQNGSLTTTAPTAFTNVVSARGYQQQVTHGTMQGHVAPYQLPDSRLAANDDDDDLQSMDSASEGRTPTQSDQQIPGPTQTRKRRRGVIEKRRRDRINSSLAELRRLVPAAFEKQGSQKLEKAEILQMTVDHLRYLNSKGFDTLWRDQQRYATEYYSMGYRVCISEVDTFLSKEGMDMQDPLRLRLMSHLQCVGVQRQSAFNVWTTTAHQNPHHYQHAQHQASYWPSTAAATTASPASSAAAGLQYAVYGVIPTPEVVYPSQVPTSSNGQQVHDGAAMFKNGLTNGTQAQAPPTSFCNGTMMSFTTLTPASSSAAPMSNGASVNGNGY